MLTPFRTYTKRSFATLCLVAVLSYSALTHQLPKSSFSSFTTTAIRIEGMASPKPLTAATWSQGK